MRDLCADVQQQYLDKILSMVVQQITVAEYRVDTSALAPVNLYKKCVVQEIQYREREKTSPMSLRLYQKYRIEYLDEKTTEMYEPSYT